MSTFVLVEVKDDGTVDATALTDPVTVNEAITVPLASLFPPPQATDVAPPDPNA